MALLNFYVSTIVFIIFELHCEICGTELIILDEWYGYLEYVIELFK